MTNKKLVRPSNRGLLATSEQLVIFKKIYRKFILGMSSNSKIADIVLSYLEEDDYLSILKLKVSPLDYTDRECFANDYAIHSFIKKCQDLPITVDRELAAKKVAAHAEAVNKKTTLRWNYTRPAPQVEDVLFRAEKIVEQILGITPDISSIYNACDYGPGASSSCQGVFTDITNKLSASMDVSGSALPYAIELLQRRPEFNADVSDVLIHTGPVHPRTKPRFRVVNHDTFTCVPKTALTDRGICIAPHLNIVLQKGIGSCMRERLKSYHFGYDLNDQASKNQQYAKIGSVNSDIVTIDLSAASESITTVLVEFLLPPKWFKICNDTRTKFTKYDESSLHKNYKFSAMGNGFTFELESIIFFALTLACSQALGVTGLYSDYDVFSFGDDIICNSKVVDLLTEVFDYCGFSINHEKSYTKPHPFRESCGADYWNGQNIRPLFVKELPKDEIDFLKLANAIRRYACRINDYVFSDIRLLSSWRSTVDVLEKFGPISTGSEHLGDVCLAAKPCELSGYNFTKPQFSNGQWRFQTTIYRKRKARRALNKLIQASLFLGNRSHSLLDDLFFQRSNGLTCSVSYEQGSPRINLTVPRNTRGIIKRRLRHPWAIASSYSSLPSWL